MSQPSRPVRSRRRGESGFTLIELLVVIAILGVLAAIVAFNVAGVHDRGGDAACRTDVSTVQAAVDAYRNDHADAASGAPGPVPTYAELGPYIHATPTLLRPSRPGRGGRRRAGDRSRRHRHRDPPLGRPHQGPLTDSAGFRFTPGLYGYWRGAPRTAPGPRRAE